jgi:hypothetical protein
MGRLQRAFFSGADRRPLWSGAIILLALSSVWAAGMSYLQKQHERQAVAVIENAGDEVYYSYQWSDESPEPDGPENPRAPAWVRRILGDDFFGHPTHVCCFATPDALQTLRELPTLTGVELWWVEAAGEPFAAVSAMKRLHTLKIDGSVVDFHDLADAPSIPTLRNLRLEDTSISDAVCVLIVEKFPALSELAIDRSKDWSQPSEAGLSAIRQLPNLATFSLACSHGVPNTGLAIFSGSPTLRILRAEVRGDVDGAIVRIHDCPVLDTLEILWYDGNPGYKDRPWRLHLERVPGLRELSVQGTTEVQLGDAAALESLTLEDCGLCATDLSQILSRQPLTKLELFRYDGDMDAALTEIAKVPSLKTLTICDSPLNAADVTQIGKLTHLEELDLSYNSLVNDRCLGELEAMRSLRSLKVRNTGVTAAGARRIEAAIPGLRCVLEDPR